jgi:HPt (histidine-containing phosphotransfer) domain-containing protein
MSESIQASDKMPERSQKMLSTVLNDSPVLDMSQLKSITLEDLDLMREIVSALVEDTHFQINLLRDALDRVDMRECARVAHSARGACGNVGAVTLAALFTEVEREAKQGNISDCRTALMHLANEVEKLRSQSRTI